MNNSRSCRLARALSIACLFILIIPQTNFAQTEKGIELYNLWKFQEAQNVLREAFDADQKDIKAGYFLGLSLLFAEKHAEALDVLLKVEAGLGKTPAAARPAVPMPCQVQVGLARARLGLEQYEEAWKNLEAARKMDPDF
ncbi:MAG TPA: hypothetical protein VLL97_01575, partial [Acidobacteriota bacterium]|nr:hypothetical protein [Acidobacteriota bacterium]